MKQGHRQMGSLWRRRWNEWSERHRNTHLRPDICWQRHALLLGHLGEGVGACVCVWVQKRLFVHVCLFLCLCETVSKCEWEHATWPGLITTSFQGPSKHEQLPRYCLGWPAKNTGQSNTHTQMHTRANTVNAQSRVYARFKRNQLPSSCNHNYLLQKGN